MKKKYCKKSFESNGSNSDTSANIYISMMLSLAWLALTKQQQVLYLACKGQYYGEKKKPYNNPLYFTMNRSKWHHMYKLYSLSNSAGFYRDMSALIEHGFIICIESGASTRTKNIYAFSDKWQNYGEPYYKVDCKDRTLSAQRRYERVAKECAVCFFK